MPEIRRGRAEDLPAIALIQEACPEASHWNVGDYILYDLWVAESANRIAGFLAARSLGADECELLNLAVAPEFRRQGIARALVQALANGYPCTIFLEVRESNQAARSLYKSIGFQELGVRPGYYSGPPESAIVMKFHSC